MRAVFGPFTSLLDFKIGNYAFTTLRPVPALVRIDGVLVQFVEIPGLLEGANDDHGGGRAYLGVLREADAVVYCQDATAPPDDLRSVMGEVARAGVERPALVAVTKVDNTDAAAVERIGTAFPGLSVVATSVLDDSSLARLKAAAWQLTGLIRVHVREGGDPYALPPGSTVLDVAAAIHSKLVGDFRGARGWGPSARYEGQRVGRDHVVLEGDAVEVLTA
jgi:ribosome-interacting GTPase 1